MTTRITPKSSDSTLPYIEFGSTEGDNAGRLYIVAPHGGIAFFTPEEFPRLFAIQKEASEKAIADARTKRVTVGVTPTMSDAEIVAAVKAALQQ